MSDRNHSWRDIVTEDQDRIEFPKLWVSYPWINSEERDFAYLTRHLENVKFDAVYDSIPIMSDHKFSQRIIQRLQSVGCDGWLYVLTHQCISRKDYTGELLSAIDQTKLRLGPRFPMVGLMYGIADSHLPPMLRVLPTVSLGDPDWNSLVREIYLKSRSEIPKKPACKESRFIWKIHPCFGGDPSFTAIEVRSRGETIPQWRFAIPKSCHLIRWGQGRAGGGEISRVRFEEASGSGQFNNNQVFWFGAANTVSNSESAYVLFSGKLPDFICFGPAQKGCGQPGRMEIFWPGHELNTSKPSIQ